MYHDENRVLDFLVMRTESRLRRDMVRHGRSMFMFGVLAGFITGAWVMILVRLVG